MAMKKPVRSADSGPAPMVRGNMGPVKGFGGRAPVQSADTSSANAMMRLAARRKAAQV